MTDADSRSGTDRLLTVPEAAEQLRFSTETVRRMLREGRLRGIRMGSTRAGWRVPESAIAAFIESRIAMTEQAR